MAVGLFGRAAQLGLAAVIGQAAFLLVSPLVSRLYSPEQFGFFSPYMLAFSGVAVAATRRYELAIPGAPDSTRVQIAVYAAIRAGLVSTFVCAVIAIASISIVRPTIEMAVLYGLLLPSTLLVWVVMQVGTYIASSAMDIRSVALAKVSQGLILAVGQVAGGLLALGVAGLAGALCASLIASALCLRKVFPLRLNQVPPDELKAFYSEYRRLPMFSMPAAFLNATTVRASSALLAFSFGPEFGGQFLFAQTMLGGPVMLATRSISQAFLGEMSSGMGTDAAKALRRTVLLSAKRMATLAAAPSIAFLLWGETLFSVVFGDQWIAAGRICSLLAFAFFAQISLSPFGQLLEYLGGSRLQLIWDAFRLVMVCAVILGGYLVGWTGDTTVMWFGVVMVLFYIAQVVLALRLLSSSIGLRSETL